LAAAQVLSSGENEISAFEVASSTRWIRRPLPPRSSSQSWKLLSKLQQFAGVRLRLAPLAVGLALALSGSAGGAQPPPKGTFLMWFNTLAHIGSNARGDSNHVMQLNTSKGMIK
jgi:hypothetical protein